MAKVRNEGPRRWAVYAVLHLQKAQGVLQAFSHGKLREHERSQCHMDASKAEAMVVAAIGALAEFVPAWKSKSHIGVTGSSWSLLSVCIGLQIRAG